MSAHQSQQLLEWLEIFIHTLSELYFYPSQDGARTLFYADQGPNDRKIRIKGLQVTLWSFWQMTQEVPLLLDDRPKVRMKGPLSK